MNFIQHWFICGRKGFQGFGAPWSCSLRSTRSSCCCSSLLWNCWTGLSSSSCFSGSWFFPTVSNLLISILLQLVRHSKRWEDFASLDVLDQVWLGAGLQNRNHGNMVWKCRSKCNILAICSILFNGWNKLLQSQPKF